MWVKLVLRLLQLIVNRYKKYVRDTLHAFVSYLQLLDMPWRRGLAVSSPSATEETGAIGREIESRKGVENFVSFMSPLVLQTFSFYSNCH
jgi:hypothetical protein